jgi:hypothetical protein
MTEIKKLAEAAQKANAGPWFVCRQPNDDGTVNIETGRIGQSEWNPAQNCEYGTAEYIAAVSPDVVLALIAECDDLRAENTRLEAALKDRGEAVAWRIWSPDGTNIYQYTENGDGEPLFTQPAPREPMTDAEVLSIWQSIEEHYEEDERPLAFADAIQIHHRIGIKEKSE